MSEANNSHNQQFGNFKEFYPFYLAEHGNVVSRRLHFVGTALVLALITYIISFGLWTLLLAVPVVGYGFAWIGHFFFEKNKPATFKFPFYSLLGDFVMFFDILRGKVSILR
ncbi:Mpo1-like protein [Pseudovibrio ascidiaceicola]|uniref:Mpo1-like protein n=1 Tax=Pseudovibrio ascidiaceicola TaxID=285279 RepID=UPI003D368EA1